MLRVLQVVEKVINIVRDFLLKKLEKRRRYSINLISTSRKLVEIVRNLDPETEVSIWK
jgi:hypothetical protein